MSPPKRILFDNLILFEILTKPPSFIIRQGQTIFLKERVDSRNSVVPTFFKVIKGQSPILGLRFLSFQGIFGPHSLRINKLDVI